MNSLVEGCRGSAIDPFEDYDPGLTSHPTIKDHRPRRVVDGRSPRYCRYPLRNRPIRPIAASRSSAWGRVRMRK